jgi:hypothetical protein
MRCDRREALRTAAGLLTGCVVGGARGGEPDPPKPPNGKETSLVGEVGITTSSLSGHVAATAGPGRVTLLEWPRVLREELDLRVLDLNTSSLASTRPAYLERLRTAANDAGCVITNLKMNQRDLNLDSVDREVRERSLREYERSIDVAAELGARWARPLPRRERPAVALHVDSLKRLRDHCAKRELTLLIENFGWMEPDPNSVVALLDAVGEGVAACPDTGNWPDEETRAAGLGATFPRAVTCDFKFREVNAEGEHGAWDLERCFTIGHAAGFRGPWCLEHANVDRAALFHELALVRDRLRAWTRAAEAVR